MYIYMYVCMNVCVQKSERHTENEELRVPIFCSFSQMASKGAFISCMRWGSSNCVHSQVHSQAAKLEEQRSTNKHFDTGSQHCN